MCLPECSFYTDHPFRFQSLCLHLFHTEGVKKNKKLKASDSNKDCKETSGLLSQFKSDQNLKSTMPSRQSPPPMNCQSPARDLLVCHTFSLLIWLNIVDILLIVFSSSVLNTVRHSSKSCFFFYFILKSLV